MATHILPPPGTRRGGNATGCPTASPSRRELFSAAGFTALAGIAAVAIAKPDAVAVEVLPAPHGTDAPLLALCDRFMTLQAGINAINVDHENDWEDELDKLIKQQRPLLDKMDDLTATTLPGMQARARVLMAWYGCPWEGYSTSVLEWDRVGALFRDLLGEAV